MKTGSSPRGGISKKVVKLWDEKRYRYELSVTEWVGSIPRLNFGATVRPIKQ